MSKIVFFGASVTQQKEGYVHFFTSLINNNFCNYTIKQNGYGSMHLYDAGICFIDDIVKEKPNFCFIDWFSTGFITTDDNALTQYLDCIVRKLYLINCKICFLLFDRKDMNNERLKMYNNIITYSKKFNIDCIELYNNNNITELLRDSVHTTEIGSQFYANKIYNFFIKNIITKNISKNINSIPSENELFNTKKLTLNKNVKNNIIFKGNFKLLGIYQNIGPFSGLCQVITNNNTTIHNLWDQWCHYERQNIKLSISNSNTCLQIKILQDNFDTSSCSNKDFCFTNVKKYMHIKDIYYLGELNVDSIDSTNL